jgi:hypothetical protein
MRAPCGRSRVGVWDGATSVPDLDTLLCLTAVRWHTIESQCGLGSRRAGLATSHALQTSREVCWLLGKFACSVGKFAYSVGNVCT